MTEAPGATPTPSYSIAAGHDATLRQGSHGDQGGHMDVARFRADTSPGTLVEVLLRDGALIIEDVISSDTVDQIVGELEPYMGATPTGPDDFTGVRTRRTGGLIGRSETCRELVMHPTVQDVANQLIGGRIQLHLTQVIGIGPGQPAQPVHRDQWAFDFFPFPDDYHVQCNTIWALTDFTQQNGATRLAIGSQHDENDLRRTHEGMAHATMRKGSVLLYTGKVYHSGGENTSDTVRRGCNITYCASWVRQEENQYLSTPPEVLDELDEDILRLMGYARGAYALGYIDDLRDPIAAIRPDLAAADGLGET